MKLYYYSYDTIFGDMTIVSGDEAVAALMLPGETFTGGVNKATKLTGLAAEQLAQFLKGERRVFDLPLRPCGTAFQLAVWAALTAIPYGETRSYKQIAEAAGYPKAYRAAGMANNRNPIPIIIPCHRVVGYDGRLTGYRGGLEMKEKLLKLEAGIK